MITAETVMSSLPFAMKAQQHGKLSNDANQTKTLQKTKFINQLPEFEINLKTKVKPSKLFTIQSTADGAAVARKCFNEDHIEWIESFIAIAVDRSLKVLGFYKISTGGTNSVEADPKVILQFALLSNATAIILAHNHPGGKVTPSNVDIDVTFVIERACNAIRVKLIDHIIITSESYYSFSENGYIKSTSNLRKIDF